MTTAFEREPALFDKTKPGRCGVSFSFENHGHLDAIDAGLLRRDLDLPELTESDVVRHFVALSKMNYGVDDGLYPLGSCTMKYNPKINEVVAGYHGFNAVHPFIGDNFSQGALALMKRLSDALCAISGMDAVTLHPSAGAHGEFTGLKIVKAYHQKKGNTHKDTILIPDTAHGTNPATASMIGYKTIEIASSKTGILDLEETISHLTDNIAAIMVTNPNTLGLFEKNLPAIAKAAHEKDILIYADGANLNALLGNVDLAKIGVDILHINLHKTFSTPHGGGGPGAGPVAVRDYLKDFLPAPHIDFDGERYSLDFAAKDSIGMVKGFYGNFLILVRALTYILSMGGDNLRTASNHAILNANYVKESLKGDFAVAHDTTCAHEVVFSDKFQEPSGVSTLDIAKRLIDYGYHPPTIYFPLVVHGAMMIEPTETESKDSIDRFMSTMRAIAVEAKESPDTVRSAPSTTRFTRFDEVLAARKPQLIWKPKI